MNRRISGTRLATLAGAGLMVFSSSAGADFVKVIPNHFGQPEPQEILSHVYQTALSPRSGNYTNGAVTATRLPDGGTDAALIGPKFVATAIGRFSDYTQSYGLSGGTTFTPAFEVTGK